MSTSSNHNEKSHQHGEKSRPEASIVVSGTLPLRKPIAQKVIITLSARSAQDVGHYTQTRKAIAGFFGLCFDFRLGWLLALGCLVLAGNGFSLHFIGVQHLGALAVGFVDLVLVSTGGCAYEVVEGDADAFGELDFIAETEDFLVWVGLLAIGSSCCNWAPSRCHR